MAKENSTLRPLTPDERRLALMLKALGNPVRFHMVQVLAERKMCITGELVEFTTLAQSTVSQHLKVLREAGLVAGEVEGPATCYCLNEDGIRWLRDRIGDWLSACCYSKQAAGETDRPEAPSCR